MRAEVPPIVVDVAADPGQLPAAAMLVGAAGDEDGDAAMAVPNWIQNGNRPPPGLR
jgi:hypothetical protein